jgi:predicted ATP-grasp superfamily ATP-dependent carboligase
MHASAKISSISVLIPDGDTWEAVKVLRCLSHVSGITAHVLAKARFPLARFSRYYSSYHCHKSENNDDWIRAIKSIVRSLRIDVVLPVTEKGIELVARNRKAISEFVAIPPIADSDLISMSEDKWSFQCFAKENGFSVPASVLIGKAGETSIALSDIDSIEYPALLKPTLLDGGFGIVKVKEPSDLADMWNNERIIKGYQYMLQSYIPGVVFCLGLYSQGGQIISYTLWKTLLTSTKRLYFSARAMEYVNNEEVIELTKRLISAMKWDGIANIDFLVGSNDGSVKILDFNPRFGQSLLGSLVAGVNFPLLSCLGAMGMEYPSMQQQDAIRYVHPATQCKLIMSRFMGRRPPVKVQWKHGSLQFAVRDPLPELVYTFRRIVKRFQSRNHVNR